MKKSFVCWIMIVIAIFLPGCSGKSQDDIEEEVFSMVVENKDTFKDAVEELRGLSEDTEYVGYSDGKQKYAGEKVIDEGVYRAVYNMISVYQGEYEYEPLESDTLQRLFEVGVEKMSIHDSHIDFFVFGTGFATHKGYYGVYYVANGAPLPASNFLSAGGDTLIEDETGGWRWATMNDEISYYTRQIVDGFYYYFYLY